MSGVKKARQKKIIINKDEPEMERKKEKKTSEVKGRKSLGGEREKRRRGGRGEKRERKKGKWQGKKFRV